MFGKIKGAVEKQISNKKADMQHSAAPGRFINEFLLSQNMLRIQLKYAYGYKPKKIADYNVIAIILKIEPAPVFISKMITQKKAQIDQ